MSVAYPRPWLLVGLWLLLLTTRLPGLSQSTRPSRWASSQPALDSLTGFVRHEIKLPGSPIAFGTPAYYDNQYSSLYVGPDANLYLMSESRIQDGSAAFVDRALLRSLDSAIAQPTYQPRFTRVPINNLQAIRTAIGNRRQTYEGLEAMVIIGTRFYFTIETTTASDSGYVVKGTLRNNTITLDPTTFVGLKKPRVVNGGYIGNAGFESLEVINHRLHAFFEYNTFATGNQAVVLDTTLRLTSVQRVPMARTPFRLTDVNYDTARHQLVGLNYLYYKDYDYRPGSADPQYRRVYGRPDPQYTGPFDGEYHHYNQLVALDSVPGGGFQSRVLGVLPSEVWGYNYEGLASYQSGFFATNDTFTPNNNPRQSVLVYFSYALNGSPTTVPAAVASPQAASGDAQVTLTWDFQNYARYAVQRASSSAGPYTTLASNLTGTRYLDRNRPNGITAYYQVVPTTAAGTGPASRPLPATPQSNRFLYLSFDDSTATVARDAWGGYSARRRPNAGRVPGYVGTALRLDGSAESYAVLDRNPLAGLTDFTFATRVKLSALDSYARIFDLGAGTDADMFLTPQSYVSNGKSVIRYVIAKNGSPTTTLDYAYAWPLNTWVHLALTQAGTTVRLYVNGTLAATATGVALNPASLTTGPLGAGTQHFLGRSQYRADANLRGQLDDVTFYNRALSATEVLALVVPPAVTWTGAASTDWATPGNWSPTALPGATTVVTVPAVPNQPLVSTAGATCAALTSQAGSTLRVAAPGYLTLTGDLQATGAVALSGGTLEAQGPNVHFDGGLAATGGTVLLSGVSRQEVGTNGGGATFWNLTVGARASGAAQPYGDAVNVRRVLTLKGDFDTSSGGVLNLLSDATGTAMVVNAGGRLLGPATMQRYIGGSNTGLGYRHLSVPSQATTIGQLTAPSGYVPVLNAAYNTAGAAAQPFPNFFGYDEARQGAAGVPGPVGFDQGWFSPASSADYFAPGRGYTVNLPGTARPVVASGFFTTGDVPVGALSASGSGASAGYHLLGNPYPSPIAWDSVARPAGLDNAVYVYRSTGPYSGFYDAYANGVGTLPSGGQLAAMQGFFVHVSQAVPSFSFTNAARKRLYADPSFQRGRGGAGGRPLLALALRPAGGGEADPAFIYFEAGATAGPDPEFDAGKLANPSGLNLASESGSYPFAINGLPPLDATPLVLPLTVSVPATGAYELAVTQLADFAPGTTLYLRDGLLNTLTPLTAATHYAFSLTGYAAPGRFAVEFRPAGALASTAQVLAAQVQVFPNPAHGPVTLVVPGIAGAPAAQVELLNSLGQVVARQPAFLSAGGTQLTLPTAGLAAGVYTVRLRAGEIWLIKRLVIN